MYHDSILTVQLSEGRHFISWAHSLSLESWAWFASGTIFSRQIFSITRARACYNLRQRSTAKTEAISSFRSIILCAHFLPVLFSLAYFGPPANPKMRSIFSAGNFAPTNIPMTPNHRRGDRQTFPVILQSVGLGPVTMTFNPVTLTDLWFLTLGPKTLMATMLDGLTSKAGLKDPLRRSSKSTLDQTQKTTSVHNPPLFQYSTSSNELKMTKGLACGIERVGEVPCLRSQVSTTMAPNRQADTLPLI